MNSQPYENRLVKPQPFLKSNGKWVIVFAEGTPPPNPEFIYHRTTWKGCSQVEFDSKESAEQFIVDNPDRWNGLLFGLSPDTEGRT